MDLEDIMLIETSQRSTHTAWHNLHVESKKKSQIIDTVEKWLGGGASRERLVKDSKLPSIS